MFEVQEKQLGHHVKQKLSIFWEQLFAWDSREFLSCQGLVDICSEEIGKVIDVILKTNNFKTYSNIKAQKDAGSINLLEYLEKSAKHKAECLLNQDGSSAAFVNSLRNSISYTFYHLED